MEYYLAPMEGITGYVYRNAYHSFFRNADKYFTPFIAPNQTRKLSARERNDILPEHNKGMVVVPQILTKNASDFLWGVDKVSELGYHEVNLNLGCPSRTVVSKGKGAGFLGNPDELDRFLEEIFSKAEVRISIKTRIGISDRDEFQGLLEIFNRYPLEELIIHPRLQQDYYQNTPNLEVFADAVENSVNKIGYNGDIFTPENLARCRQHFPEVDIWMLGRGILRNPYFLDTLEGSQTADKAVLRRFHDKLFEDYGEAIPGEKNVLFKMKELWTYLGHTFTDSTPYMKKIKKAQNFTAYVEAVERLFEEQQILANEKR